MMEWMSRMLDGEMAGADEDFGAEVGKMWLNFGQSPNHKSNSDDPHGPDDPFRMINYHYLDISGHDGMDEQDTHQLLILRFPISTYWAYVELRRFLS
jgi:hypothetical protein